MNAKELGAQPISYMPDTARCNGSDGLTKREAFAMATMQGVLAGDSWDLVTVAGDMDVPTVVAVARVSVMFADALLAELAKE